MESPTIEFGFGFDSTAYSDRVLHIRVIPELLDSNPDFDVEVKKVNICSLLLAARSRFFQKLFENGMRESQQRDVTIRVCASDEEAYMDIIRFMYTNTLSAFPTELLGRLIAADKFEVISCMKYCSDLLKALPMSVESALSYLELPASVSQNEVVQPLIVAAKEYLVKRFSDLKESQAELVGLPLCVVEVVLSGDGLRVDSEDDVFDFILEWSHTHYPQSKERIEILTTRLVKCLCFPMMSVSKLKEVLACAEFADEQVSKLVLEALFLKIEAPYLQHVYLPDSSTTNFNSLRRIYPYGPIRVMHIEGSHPICIVYFYLSKDECENLLPTQKINSPKFILGGREFNLVAKCCSKEQQKKFGVYLRMTVAGSESCKVEFEYAIMKKSSKKFHKIHNATSYVYTKASPLPSWGFENLLGISWNEFISKDSEYFTNGILQLQIDITIINPST